MRDLTLDEIKLIRNQIKVHGEFTVKGYRLMGELSVLTKKWRLTHTIKSVPSKQR